MLPTASTDGHVFVLETGDLIDYFEQKVKRTLTPRERWELFKQLATLLRYHHPCDLHNRGVLIYDGFPTLISKGDRHDENVSETMLASLYDKFAYNIMIELYKRMTQHYLYDRNHVAQFTPRGMAGKNIILEIIPAGAAIYELQSQRNLLI